MAWMDDVKLFVEGIARPWVHALVECCFTIAHNQDGPGVDFVIVTLVVPTVVTMP